MRVRRRERVGRRGKGENQEQPKGGKKTEK